MWRYGLYTFVRSLPAAKPDYSLFRSSWSGYPAHHAVRSKDRDVVQYPRRSLHLSLSMREVTNLSVAVKGLRKPLQATSPKPSKH